MASLFGEVVAHDIDLLLKVIDSNTDHMDRLSMIVSQTATVWVNITLAPNISLHAGFK